MATPTQRQAAEAVLLDAAERLLVTVGYAQISTRRLAEEANVNHGLVHYYFGSMEHLFLRVLERFTERLIVRQRAMYASTVPFSVKWRAAMRYLDEDQASGYQKMWLELQAMAWNRPELRERLAWVHGQWRAVLTEAFSQAMAEYGIDTDRFPVAAVVALVITFNEGIILERLCGITAGQEELLALIERVFNSLEESNSRRKEMLDASKIP